VNGAAFSTHQETKKAARCFGLTTGAAFALVSSEFVSVVNPIAFFRMRWSCQLGSRKFPPIAVLSLVASGRIFEQNRAARRGIRCHVAEPPQKKEQTMSKKYVVYFKGTARPTTIECSRLTIDDPEKADAAVSLYNHVDKLRGLLVIANVIANIAALFPERQHTNDRGEPFGFNVKLKGTECVFVIHASEFAVKDGAVTFKRYDTSIDDIYVAVSEVSSIFPVKGMDGER
jgi:hypothetical protein